MSLRFNPHMRSSRIDKLIIPSLKTSVKIMPPEGGILLLGFEFGFGGAVYKPNMKTNFGCSGMKRVETERNDILLLHIL